MKKFTVSALCCLAVCAMGLTGCSKNADTGEGATCASSCAEKSACCKEGSAKKSGCCKDKAAN